MGHSGGMHYFEMNDVLVVMLIFGALDTFEGLRFRLIAPNPLVSPLKGTRQLRRLVNWSGPLLASSHKFAALRSCAMGAQHTVNFVFAPVDNDFCLYLFQAGRSGA